MKRGTVYTLSNEKKITIEQYETVLEAALGSRRDWMLIFLGGSLGLRVSEVLHLRSSDFYPESGTIKVVRRKKPELKPEPMEVNDDIFPYVEKYIEEEEIGDRKWLFPGLCGPCMRNWTFREKEGNRTKKWVEEQKVCSGGHITVRRAEAIWDRLAKRARIKVPGRGIHSLRHYNATRYYGETRDLRATQMHMGHSSPLTTQVYADAVEMREKANKVKVSVGKSPWNRKGR